jgi:hypothetical protein
MKNNRNVTYLIENGLSAKTVANLSESQIKLLVEKFKKETKEQTEVKTTVYDTTDPEQKKKLNQALQDPTKMQGQNIQVKETEMTEDDTDDVTSSNALGKDAEQSYTGQEAPHDANDMADDGMDDDSSDDRSMMGMSESKLNEKFESKAQQGPKNNTKKCLRKNTQKKQ